MATYNGPYTYEHSGLEYEGLFHAPAIPGDQPSGSGALGTRRLIPRALSGAQPAGSAGLAQKLLALRAPAGAAPAGSAVLTSKGAPYRRGLAGAPLAPSGALLARLLALRALDGNQDPATGQLAVRGAFKRAPTGAQPAGTGLLTAVLRARRALTGAQLGGAASLARTIVIVRHLDGIQPVSGTTYEQTATTYEQARIVYENPPSRLTYRGIFVRVLLGHQPAGHGGVGHDQAVDAGLFVYTPHESSPTVIYLGATDPNSDVLAPREDADELVYSAREGRTPTARTAYRTRERTTASTYRPG